MNDYTKALLALVGGCILVFSFAPFAYRFVAFLSPALLLWCLLDARRSAASLYGFLFGIGFFSVGVSWIFISIHTYGEAPIAIAVLITLLFVLALAAFTTLIGWMMSFYKSPLNFQCLALFPAIWVSVEWLRSWVLTGFPWLFVGYSQVDTSLKYFAPFIGVYGLSFLVTFISGALILIIKGRIKDRIMAFVAIALIWSGAQALAHYQLPHDSKAISVSLIQGDIPQSLKWDPEQAVKTLKIYKALTEAQSPHTLIIWPEAAIPLVKSQAHTYLQYMQQLLRQKDQTLITGIPIDAWPVYYNGILMLGQAKGEYLKIHLVPFGEYYPMKWLLGPVFDYLKIPMSDLTPGPDTQGLLDANGIKIAPFICYEIAYPQQVLNQAQRAEVLVTVSDDSWFGNSIAAEQHLEIAQLRALETQRYILFSTNSGISAVINPQGQLMAKLGMNQQGVLHTQIHTVSGVTPLMRWGYTPLALFILALIVIGLRIRAPRGGLRRIR